MHACIHIVYAFSSLRVVIFAGWTSSAAPVVAGTGRLVPRPHAVADASHPDNSHAQVAGVNPRVNPTC